MVLPISYFWQDAEFCARDLIGKVLCHRTANGEVFRGSITETECYCGVEDTACHAHKGKTNRTRLLYEQGGISYIFLCYGIHSLLNFVTGAAQHPEAVLIRGVEGFSGPGRLTKGFGIDRSLNGLPLTEETGLWVEDKGAKPALCAAPRIGIGYAAPEDQARLWRFFVQHNPC